MIKEGSTQQINATQESKMLNINAAAKHLTENYTGPFIDPTTFKIPIVYRKSKQLLVTALLDATRNLFSSGSDIRTKFNTGMGFVIGKMQFLNAL